MTILRTAAIALTLFDYDTPIWLDKPLMTSDAVKTFLRFHTGCPIVTEPVEAAFALVSAPVSMIPLASFNQGSAEYPDRSTTVILTGQESTDAFLNNGTAARDRYGVREPALEAMIAAVADWLVGGGDLLGKPTHFESRDGKY